MSSDSFSTAILRHVSILLGLIATLLFVGGESSAQYRRLALEACEASVYGWLESSIVRKVDPEKEQLMDSFATVATVGDIQKQTALEMEAALFHAAGYFSTVKPGTPLHLLPPPKLLCVTDPGDGKKRYVQVVVSSSKSSDPLRLEKDVLAQYHKKPFIKDGTPDIRLSPDVVDAFRVLAAGGMPGSEEISTPAHELFHAVQVAYRFFTVCEERLKPCGRRWVTEGLADAFAYAWLRSYEQKSGKKIKLERGMRYLDHSLHIPPEMGKYEDDAHYATSLFWSYLAGGPNSVDTEKNKDLPWGRLVGMAAKGPFNPNWIKRFMQLDKTHILKYGNKFERAECAAENAQTDMAMGCRKYRGKQWELEWLDKSLKDSLVKDRNSLGFKNPRNPKGGLFIIYPKFAAWLVAHQTNTISAQDMVGNPTWHQQPDVDKNLERLFDTGCAEITLQSGNKKAQTTTLWIHAIATACLRVSRSRTHITRPVSISMTGPREYLKQIHLGWNGEVIPPKGNSRRSKKWVVGLLTGAGSSNPTGADLILAFSNVPEDISSIVKLEDGELPEIAKVELKIRYSGEGG